MGGILGIRQIFLGLGAYVKTVIKYLKQGIQSAREYLARWKFCLCGSIPAFYDNEQLSLFSQGKYAQPRRIH